MTQSSTKPVTPLDPTATLPARAASLFPPVPGRPADVDQFGIDAVTIARLWDNPCWFSFRINYLSLRYNIPLYGWVEKEYGLIRPQVAVIYALGLRDMVTARDIGISYGFPKNTLSRAIHSLERRGIVARRRDASDKRSFLLTLTAEGRAIFDETLPRFVGGQEDILSPLTAGERETLSVLLAKIVLNTFDRPDGIHCDEALIHSDGTGA